MKKILSISLCLFFINFLSCSGFNIKKSVSDKPALNKLKKSGIVIRVWENSSVKSSEIKENLEYWIAGCSKINNFVFIKDGSPELLSYSSEHDKFFQRDTGKSFLTDKSAGIFRIYQNKHRQELADFISSNALDSIIFYEADGFFSPELQFININSTVIISDSNFNLIYMDSSTNDENVDEWDKDALKKLLLDKISERFIYSMESLNYLEKITN